MQDTEIRSEVTGTVWSVEAAAGSELEEDDVIVFLESMKMEIPVTAPARGKLTHILVSKGDTVAQDQVIALMQL